MVESLIVGLPVVLHGAFLIAFDGFTFWKIIYIFNVVCDFFLNTAFFDDCLKCVILDGD